MKHLNVKSNGYEMFVLRFYGNLTSSSSDSQGLHRTKADLGYQVNLSFGFPATSRDGVIVMCNGNALQCITFFEVMCYEGFYHYL